jgi:hypothetical protein
MGEDAEGARVFAHDGGATCATSSPSSDRVTPGPLGGSGAARPSGALRAIDPCGTAAFLADLRSAPRAAAIPTCPGGHPRWYGMTKAAGTAGRSEVVWLAVVAAFRFVAEPR